MDATTIMIGKETRNEFREYKEEQGFDNYDEALKSLLQHTKE